MLRRQAQALTVVAQRHLVVAQAVVRAGADVERVQVALVELERLARVGQHLPVLAEAQPHLRPAQEERGRRVAVLHRLGQVLLRLLHGAALFGGGGRAQVRGALPGGTLQISCQVCVVC